MIVEADVEPGHRLGRDDIGRRVADADIGDFKVRRIEPVAAVIEQPGLERRQDGHQPRHRVVGPVRVGDMALRAPDGQPGVERAAPADLDGVAQPLRRCRFADEAGIRHQPLPFQPVEHRRRAEGRRAFFVAGDDQRQPPRGAAPDMAGRCRDKSRDGPLHVGRAAPDQPAIGDGGRKGIDAPRCDITRRHDIGMAGKGEMPAAADGGEQIVDRAIGRGAEAQAMDGEAQRRQRIGQHVLRPGIVRGDAGAADQALRQGNRITGHDPLFMRRRYAPDSRRCAWH